VDGGGVGRGVCRCSSLAFPSVRILHTSDWHLGRSFHREGLLGAQARFVDHLVDTVRGERVDLVLVSGDVYDRALPPVDAVTLAAEALRRLADQRVRVVLISGNHDSAQRLGFAADLIDSAGIHLRTDPSAVGAPILLRDDDGPVAVYGIPYSEPELVRDRWALPDCSHTAALTAAMARVGTNLRARPPGTRSVVLAHAFVTGGAASDSERDISVGGLAHVPAEVFAGIDYVALGHLHGRQTMTSTVRYSGSPIAYSFSEASHTKGCWLIDLMPSGLRSAEFVPAPVPRRLAKLRGRLDQLLTDRAHAALEDCWLQVTLTDPIRPRAPMERLRARFPHTLVLAFEPDGGQQTPTRSWAARATRRSDSAVAQDFVADVRGEPADPAEAALLAHACDGCRLREGAA
jgi:DNA repair protein SbcD/Mre11